MTEWSPLLAASETSRLSDVCPNDVGGCGSSLFFSWLTPLLDLGNQRPLQLEDLYQLNPPDRATGVFASFEREWRAEVASATAPRMWRALAKAFGGPFVVAGALKLLHIASQFVGPLLIKSIVAYLGNPDATLQEGLWYCAAILISGVLQSFALRQYYFYCYEIGLRLRTAVVMSVYHKALVLTTAPSTGEVTNLMSVDAQRLQELPNYAHAMWFTVVQVATAFYLMYLQLGVAFVAGILVMLLLVPVTSAISAWMRALQEPLMTVKDDRQKVTFEVLAGIKVLKLQAWEPSFIARILAIRTTELRKLRDYVFAKAYAGVLFNAVPSIVTVAAFATYVYLGHNLDIGTALTSVALFEILRVPLYNVPAAMNAVVEAAVSFRRLEAYNALPERVPVTPGDLTTVGIRLQDASFAWEGHTPTLQRISISWGMDTLVAVVGRVGAGKSSLVQAVLGNLCCIGGSVHRKGSVAYVSQQPFIQNATLRDNITFGLPFEHAKYQEAVRVASLAADLHILPGGDLTEIGEKGINLSGGQRTRVAIARAVYQDADIYLLDDPLAAVDSHVGADIFKQCIQTALKGKLVVLVTNGLHFLKDCDDIVVLADGCIAEHGSYADLVADAAVNPVLAAMLVSIQTAPADGTTGVATGTTTVIDDGTPPERAPRTSNMVSATSSGDSGVLMSTEDRAVGYVPWSTYRAWISGCGGYGVAICVIVAFAVAQATQVACTLWLSYWSQHASSVDQRFYLGVFVVLNIGATLAFYLRSILFFVAALVGADTTFASVLRRVLRAPVGFFDTTPLGRVVNRLSKDVYAVDESLPANWNFFLGSLASLVSAVAMAVVATPWFAVALLPLCAFYYVAQKYYLAASCELQRLDAVSRSPVYALLTETLDGLATIRAYEVQTAFAAKQAALLDTNQRAYYLSCASACWLGLRLECIGTVAATIAAVLAVSAPHNAAFAGLAGVSLSYSFSVAQVLNWTVRCLAILQTQMVSVERLEAYASMATEAKWTAPQAVQARLQAQGWPSEGCVVFEHVDLRYRSGLPRVLRDLSFAIRPKEKVGIVGRTGAGKSSLVVALMRIVEPTRGRILLDGVDVTTIGLHDLRDQISIIPQDPVLFSGTIRSNLDPFGRYDDAALWTAVKRAHFAVAALDDKVDERGHNFSVGERQLICIARALLKKSKVILMDEATASIDANTDRLIQQSIREEFVECTTLTIAHRINTILDCDRILVMDKGSAAEFDAPAELLKNPNGLFTDLVAHWRDSADD
ncbi:ATP-binding Cassette (ABC) Superfamily [Achlya hypogyna]|uniref:ATP-binding Cassette (ABC) Superfamily n=1 Tax=Achlya hypogyna TaxID=1202772 RepID=A0A1V9YGL2_ACHHY|nr:ATP-binding Cassette (ABC) Superfamily [Achlya hypogyna]